MTLYFSDAVTLKQPGRIGIPCCTKVSSDTQEIIIRIKNRDRDFLIARVVSDEGRTSFAIDPRTYAAIFDCPVGDTPMRFYSVEVRVQGKTETTNEETACLPS